MNSGIYEIVNAVNGKSYIGQAVDIKMRWHSHRGRLKRGTAHNSHLQNAWNKYGESSFKFNILGLCAPEHLMLFEQAWMDARKPEYNNAPASGSMLGFKHTAETRAKVAAARMGRKASEATRLKMSIAAIGHKVLNTTRAKISAAQKGRVGRKQTDVSRAKLSAAGKGNTNALGYKQSNETKEKRANSNRGKRRTPEARKKMSDWQIGRILTPEHRAKISRAHAGKILTLEHRAKMSAAQVRRWERHRIQKGEN